MPSTMLDTGKYREKKPTREGRKAGKRIILSTRNTEAEKVWEPQEHREGHLTKSGREGGTGTAARRGND